MGEPIEQGTGEPLGAEAFNLLNRTNYLDTQTNFSSTNFGVTHTTLSARELQLAAKIVF